jgi:hypothetical protein
VQGFPGNGKQLVSHTSEFTERRDPACKSPRPVIDPDFFEFSEVFSRAFLIPSPIIVVADWILHAKTGPVFSPAGRHSLTPTLGRIPAGNVFCLCMAMELKVTSRLIKETFSEWSKDKSGFPPRLLISQCSR